MNGKGFNPRSLIIVLAVIGVLAGAWVGSRIDHETMFLGVWSAALAGVGAIVGAWLGSVLSKYL